jgi:hypothetical protein
MTLGNTAAKVCLIVWCLPFGERHGFAGCRERCYQVEPCSPIPPKWRDDTAPKLPFPNSVSGWLVPAAGVTMPIWW